MSYTQSMTAFYNKSPKYRLADDSAGWRLVDRARFVQADADGGHRRMTTAL